MERRARRGTVLGRTGGRGYGILRATARARAVGGSASGDYLRGDAFYDVFWCGRVSVSAT